MTKGNTYIIKYGRRKGTVKHKIIQSMGKKNYDILKKISDDRDITVQELIRGIIIPEWLKVNKE